ncbi:MAG: amidohydrolase family protein [Pyrinomonadaceae bacterium]
MFRLRINSVVVGLRLVATGSILFVLAFAAGRAQTVDKRLGGATDAHVHLLSPGLIKIWKGLGVPFSRSDEQYSDIDVILKNAGTKRIDLISMAHVFSSSDFGEFKNERELVEAENAYVAAARDKHPKKVRAFCSVEPLRDYALAELERCRTRLKIDGIKLHHNASQVYLTEPDHVKKVKPVFEFAAKHKLPILLHFDNSHRKFGADDVNILVGSILNDLKPVTLTIAHFGTSGGFTAKTKSVIDAFVHQFETNPKLKKHKITFDISAVALDKDSEGVKKLTAEEFAELAVYVRKLGVGRVVFGTDYPLYSPREYLNILRQKVGLDDDEIQMLLKSKN